MNYVLDMPWYVKTYVLIVLAYFWYRFIFLFYTEWNEKKHLQSLYSGQLISVLIPYYNESLKAMEDTLKSVLSAKGNKEIIVVDDGSPDRTVYDQLCLEFPEVTFVRYSPNKGKRIAQSEGTRFINGEFIVTVDSDTIIDKNALIYLINPFIEDPIVGATTGNVKVQNQSQNLLTKMIATRYWNAFNIERKSLSKLGIVTCCSGVLSCYRTSLFMELLPKYITQRFLGQECTYGDDRHLTNLVMMRKYKIHYVGDAVCHTLAPTSLGKFVRQQLRWKKSFIRESLITLTYTLNHSTVLTFEVLFNLIIPFMSLIIRIGIIASLFVYPHLIPWLILSIATVALIRNFFLFFEDKKMVAYAIPYAFIHELVIFWLYFIAVFSLRSRGWGTR